MRGGMQWNQWLWDPSLSTGGDRGEIIICYLIWYEVKHPENEWGWAAMESVTVVPYSQHGWGRYDLMFDTV